MYLALTVLCLLPFALCKPERVDHGAGSHKAPLNVHGVHNPVYDREALLGNRDIDELTELSDEVRVKRLTTLARSHDENNNGFIETTELKNWVMQSFRMLDAEEALDKYKEEDEDKDGKVTFAEILHKQYGYKEEELKELEKMESEDEESEIYMHIMDDKKKFDAADLDKSGSLDENEYRAYFQPYDYPHMYAAEMDRTMREMDTNKNGFIDRDEFLGEGSDEEEGINFGSLDKDKDGKLTSDEIRPYALPDNNEVADEEVEHLVRESDSDKDGKLSIQEIVEKEDEFVQSAATDYGRNLHFVRDEL